MIFKPLELSGLYLIEPERHEDERGYFVRTWCQEEFGNAIGKVTFVQASQSFNKQAGTIRGLHYQAAPFGETKLVRCIRGAIYDVAVDIRPWSPTRGRWIGVEMSEENGLAILIPDGFAHGFQTLRDDSEVAYQISEYHRPDAARGIRWDDAVIGVRWPMSVTAISSRDRNWPDFAAEHAA